MNNADVPNPLNVDGFAPAVADFRALAPTPLEIMALAVLVVLESMFASVGGFGLVNLAGPIGLIAIAGMANWHLVSGRSDAIWTSIFAFRLGVLVIFGIGGLLPYVVRVSTLDYLLALYPFSAGEAATVNIIWGLGYLATMIGASAADNIFPRVFTNVTEVSAVGKKTVAIGAVFLAVGMTNVVVFEIVPLVADFKLVAPGSIRLALDAMNSVGLFLLSLWAFGRGGFRYWLVVGLVAINLLGGMIALNKSLVILPMLFIGIAFLVHRFTIWRALLVAATLMATLATLQPMVANARIQQTERFSDLSGGTLGDRIQYYVDYVQGNRNAGTRTGTDESLVRLSYVNVAAFVVSQYNSRMPDNSIENAAIALIPRVIWPNKPIITQRSSELYYSLTGSEGSAVSASVFPDIYWNLGWGGIVLISPIFGLVMMLLSRLSYGIVAMRDWIMMPFVLVCFKLGVSVDGSIVVSILAPAVMAIAIYLILRALELVISARSHKTSLVARGARRMPA